MTEDTNTPRPDEAPTFQTDTVQADRAREQGLGLGERELKAQRDPGGVRTPDVEPGAEEEGDVEGASGVQAARDDEQRLPPVGGG